MNDGIFPRIHRCALLYYNHRSRVMEYLYTLENIKRILGPPEHPGKKLSECPICSNLPENLSKVNVPVSGASSACFPMKSRNWKNSSL